MVRRVLLDVL